LLRDLMLADTLPKSWIPPEHIQDLRTLVRLRKTLVDQRSAWYKRIHAQAFHHGLAPYPSLDTFAGRQAVLSAELAGASRRIVDVALSVIDALEVAMAPIEAELVRIGGTQAGCKKLRQHFGVGPLTATAIVAELGDTRRFSSSRKAVRFAGLDITVSESDRRRLPGHLSRQGSPVLRWALYESAKTAARPASPDHARYVEVREARGAKRATLVIARNLLRWSHHALRELGEEAMAPAA
jgi:transposase